MLEIIALPTATKAFWEKSCSFKELQVRKIKNRIADQHIVAFTFRIFLILFSLSVLEVFRKFLLF